MKTEASLASLQYVQLGKETEKQHTSPTLDTGHLHKFFPITQQLV